jgi:hypothetical protein
MAVNKRETISKMAIGVGALALFTCSVLPSIARSRLQAAPDAVLDIRLAQPTVVTSGENPLEVILQGPNGEAISDADVSMSFTLPAWEAKRIPETRAVVTLQSAAEGRYIGSWTASLAGPWLTKIVVRRHGVEIGRKTFVLTAP